MPSRVTIFRVAAVVMLLLTGVELIACEVLCPLVTRSPLQTDLLEVLSEAKAEVPARLGKAEDRQQKQSGRHCPACASAGWPAELHDSDTVLRPSVISVTYNKSRPRTWRGSAVR